MDPIELTTNQVTSISKICYKKCINEPFSTGLSASEKTCLNRCSFKFLDSLKFSNRIIDLIETKVQEETKKANEENN